MRKGVIGFSFFLVALQLVGYLMFSDDHYQLSVIENQKFYYKENRVDTLMFVNVYVDGDTFKPMVFSEEAKALYREKVYPENRFFFEFIDEFESVSAYLEIENTFTCIRMYDLSFMTFSLEEYISVYGKEEPYVEIWESEYVWVLYKWVNIRRENKGLS